MLRNFYQIKVSVNRLYDDVSHVTLSPYVDVSCQQNKRSKPLNLRTND